MTTAGGAKWIRRVALAVFLSGALFGFLPDMSVFGAEERPAIAHSGEHSQRPTIGLVLSGGGALGMAHVGVLRVLEEVRVPIDLIVGTSMGAIVGGLYASGLSADEIEDAIRSIDWAAVLADATPRPERTIRRKADDFDMLLSYRLRFEDDQAVGPEGLLAGQRLMLELRRRLAHTATVRDFDHLHIPFRAVAADIETGEPVVLSRGDLARAIRASMSLPGVFSPISIDGRLLVDGGIARNLPIDFAREMGADIVIVSALPTQLKKADELRSLFSVVGQTLSLFIQRNELEQLRTLMPHDVLIETRLPPDFTASGFEEGYKSIPYGEVAAHAVQAKLTALTEEGTSSVGRPSMARVETVDRVELKNKSALSDDVILRRLKVRPGKPFDLVEFERDLAVIYGLGYFSSVDYSIEERDGEKVLNILGTPQRGNSYLEFGLEVSTDFDAETSFQLGAGYTRIGLNTLGGEARVRTSVGNDLHLSTELYQPLDSAGQFYVQPRVSAGTREVSIYDGGQRVADIEPRLFYGELSGGIEASDDLRLSAFVRRGVGDIERQTGSVAGLPDNFEIGSVGLFALYDTIDNLWWPRSGQLIAAGYEWALSTLGADPEYQAATWVATAAESFGRSVALASLLGGLTVDGEQPASGLTRLGGFARLSGFPARSLANNNALLSRLVVYRKAAELGVSVLFGLPLYYGGSLEYGSVFPELEDVASLADYTAAGSLFFGADTPFGPIYLAYGHAEGGHDAVYFFVGRPF